MKIAVEGCAHGELDKIYEALEYLQKCNNVKVDLLIICGDFQAVRNYDDLQCMAVPPKYQKLNSFYKYYSGAKVAPVLTIFIGGNHEASNYLSELSYGGWVCPNIYYMGYANVVNIGGLRIAGLSGIYKGQDYLKGHFECPPYSESEKRSVYHVRNVDVFRLKQVKQPIDIFISHDWPRGVYNFGNKVDLLRWKPFFKEEVESNKLGSRPAEELLHKLKPAYWFAAHLHCKFAAVVPHETNGEKSVTRFLALDKCLPKRKFLHVVEIPGKSDASLSVHYDPEWLCILRSTNHLLSTTKNQTYMPGPGCSQRWDFNVRDEELSTVKDMFDDDFIVPENFQHTAPPLISSSPRSSNLSPKLFINPQTTAFCTQLKIIDPFAILLADSPNKSTNNMEFSFVEDLNVTSTSQKSVDPDGASASEDEISSDEATSGSNSLSLPDDIGFFIDTKGVSRKSANESDHTGKQTFQSPGSTPSMYNKSLFTDFPEFKEKTGNETGNGAAMTVEGNPSPPKKIKRRNQAIYMSTDDS